MLFSTIIRADEGIYTWGNNAYGQIGDGTNIDTNRHNPGQIQSNKQWHKIASGGYHVLTIQSNGTLWAWGLNNHGSLGDGSNTNRNQAVQIGQDDDWVFISCGNEFSHAIKEDGTLWAWGRNYYGELGDGTTTSKNSPVKIGNDNSWSMVSGGMDHAIAIKDDGTLWAWGRNEFGQLGDGTTTNKTAPIKIGNNNDWVFVSAGTYHSMALRSDGTLWAWGNNTSGRLGDGTTNNRHSPVQIGTEEWMLVSAGNNHTIALKSDSTLWGWGDNWHGQVGDSTRTHRHSPVQSKDSSKWINIDGAWHFSFAIKADSTLWAWGNNDHGYLGDGTNVTRLSPQKITNFTNWDHVSCGVAHSTALRKNSVNILYPPILIEPADENIDVDTVLNFVWETVIGATSYILQLSTNQEFDSFVIEIEDLADTTYFYNQLSRNTVYYWRVKALAEDAESNWSQVWEFKTMPFPPDAPELISPDNESEEVSINTTLLWSEVNNAITYQVILSADSLFSNTVFDIAGLSVNEYNTSHLERFTQYYWKARASNSGGESQWSSVWSFTTTSDTIPPKLSILVNNDSEWIDINDGFASNIMRDQNIIISFDEKVRKSNGYSYSTGSLYQQCGLHRYNSNGLNYLLIENDGPVIEIYSINDSLQVAFTDYQIYFNFDGADGYENQLIIRPNVLLEPATEYLISVSGNITDYVGNAIDPAVQNGSFKTGTALNNLPQLTIENYSENSCYTNSHIFTLNSTTQNPGMYSAYSTNGINWYSFEYEGEKLSGESFMYFLLASEFNDYNGQRTLYFRDAHCLNDGYQYLQLEFIMDNLRPTANLSLLSNSPTNNSQIIFELIINEENNYIFNLDSAFTVSKGTISNISQNDSLYVITVEADSPSPQNGHTITLSVSSGTIIDCAGNSNIDSLWANAIYDNVEPTINIISPTENECNNLADSLIFNTNEELLATEYSWDGNIWHAINSLINEQYSIRLSELSGTPNSDGTYSLYIRGFDHAGNDGSASINFSIDNTPPDWCYDTPSINNMVQISKSGASFIAAINEPGTIFYKIQLSTAVPPQLTDLWEADIFIPAQMDCYGEMEDYIFEINGLQHSSEYTVYFIAEDECGNKQTEYSTVTFETKELPNHHNNLYIAGRTLSTITLRWTKHPDSDVFIVAKEAAAVDSDPEDGMLYEANSDFGDGDELGDGNYVVYYGDSNIFVLRRLKLNTIYHFVVYGVSKDEEFIYNTEQKLRISQRTLRKELQFEGKINTGDISSVSIMPNPSSEFITIDLSFLQESDIFIEILNINGQRVYNSANRIHIDEDMHNYYIALSPENFPSGVYNLIISGNNKIISQHFTVIR